MAFLYKRMRKQYSIDNGVSWIDSDPPEYIVGELIDANSDCIPDEMYQWIDVEFDSANSNTYICQGTDLYSIQKQQISEDGGKTWNDVVPITTQIGDLIQENVKLCGGDDPLYLYRWVEVEFDSGDSNTYICDGLELYSIEKQQYSEDGTIWFDVEPINKRKNELLDTESELCGGYNFTGDFSGLIKYVGVSDETIRFYQNNSKGEILNKYNCSLNDGTTNDYTCLFDNVLENILLSNMNFDITSRYILELHRFPDTTNLTNLNNFFYINNYSANKYLNGQLMSYAYGLYSINTENITTAHGTFENCLKLKEFDFSNWNFDSMNNMSNFFASNWNLKYIKANIFGGNNLKGLHGFACLSHNLINFNVNQIILSEESDLTLAFSNCSDFEDANNIFNKLDVSKIKNAYRLFEQCKSIVEFKFPENITYKLSVFNEMFSDCYALTKLDMSNITLDLSEKFCIGSYLYALTELNLDNTNFINVNTDLLYIFGTSMRRSLLKKLSLKNIQFAANTYIIPLSLANGLIELDLSNSIIGNNIKLASLNNPPIYLKYIYMYNCDEISINRVKSELIRLDLDDIVEVIY